MLIFFLFLDRTVVLLLELGIGHFLLVKEEELVLKDVGASHLDVVLSSDFSAHTLKIVLLLSEFILPGLHELVSVLSHLSEMLFQDFSIGHIWPKCDTLAKSEKV